MTGRKLYDRYSFELAQTGVEIEDWDDLDVNEQATWDALAQWVGAPTTMVDKAEVLDLLRGQREFSMGGRLVQEGWIADLLERHFQGEVKAS